MVDNIKAYFRLLIIYAKLDYIYFSRHPLSTGLYLAADLLSALASLFTVIILAGTFGGIGGVSYNEVFFMASYALCVDGIYSLFFLSNNIGAISRIVGRGQLDHFMIQPVALPIQFLASGFAPFTAGVTLLAGIVMLSFSLSQLGLVLTAGWILSLLGSLLLSFTVVLSCIYIVSTSAFYTPVASEEVSPAVREFFSGKAFPFNILAGTLQVVLTTVLPIGLTAWLPTMYLLGKESLLNGVMQVPAYMLVMASIIGALAVIIFRKGMKYYATNGSPRYTGFGHR